MNWNWVQNHLLELRVIMFIKGFRSRVVKLKLRGKYHDYLFVMRVVALVDICLVDFSHEGAGILSYDLAG